MQEEEHVPMLKKWNNWYWLLLAVLGCSNHSFLFRNRIVPMNVIDWIVLFGAIIFIVAYGTWKTRKNNSMECYLKGDNSMKWWMIGVSIMATQASGSFHRKVC